MSPTANSKTKMHWCSDCSRRAGESCGGHRLLDARAALAESRAAFSVALTNLQHAQGLMSAVEELLREQEEAEQKATTAVSESAAAAGGPPPQQKKKKNKKKKKSTAVLIVEVDDMEGPGWGVNGGGMEVRVGARGGLTPEERQNLCRALEGTTVQFGIGGESAWVRGTLHADLVGSLYGKLLDRAEAVDDVKSGTVLIGPPRQGAHPFQIRVRSGRDEDEDDPVEAVGTKVLGTVTDGLEALMVFICEGGYRCGDKMWCPCNGGYFSGHTMFSEVYQEDDD